MNTAVAVQDNAPSIIADMAKRYGMDKRAFEATVKATCMPANTNVSNEQFVAFLLVAKEYNLNPITKEIFAFPSRGGIMPIVGVDGWCNIINSNPQLDGIEFADIMTNGKLSAITCRIFRKDRSKPIECTEYLDECRIESKEPWKKWPARMLRHKALIQCARYAFSLSGIVDQDEAERLAMIDVTPTDMKPYDVDKTKPKSPFKTNAARKSFCDQVEKEYSEAKTFEEITMIDEARKNTLEAMRLSGDERDNGHEIGALGGIELKKKQAENRISLSTRETSEEDAATFDQEEVETPAYLRREIEAEQERKAAAGF